MAGERLGGVRDRLLERVASGNAAGNVGKADAVARPFVFVHKRDIAGHLSHRRSFNAA